MAKTRQQATPRELPARAAKGHVSEASTSSATAASSERHSTRSKRERSAILQNASAKKQKLDMAQNDPSPGLYNKENTISGSHPRRGTRSRTPRVVQEVTPGPALVRSARGRSNSNSKQTSQCTQEQIAPADKRSTKSKQGRSTATAPAVADEKDSNSASDDELSDIDLDDPAPSSMPLQQRDIGVVAPPEPSQTAASVPSEPFSSPQEQAPAISHLVESATHAVPLQSPCTHPSQHGLPPIPHQQPQSPHKPDSPPAVALATSNPAAAPSQAAAMPNAHALCEQSSQENSRYSSGHSNDHPVSVPARKHLEWDSAGPSSGPQSASSKPPLSRAVPGNAQAGQAAAMGPPMEGPNGDEGWWDPTDIHKVQAVRQVLHVAAAPIGQVPLCRQTQVADLQGFLGQGLHECKGGSIYVSGVPGTGKSLVVHELVRQCHVIAAGSSKCSLPPAVVSINCMSLPTPQAIFQRILTGMAQAFEQAGTRIVYPAAAASEATSSPDQSLEALQAVLTQPLPDSKKATPSKRKGCGHGMMIVICDEMDQLMSNAQEVLYDLFFLPQLLKSRLILVGIANSLDLTERLLPGLEARGCKPRLVAFPTYSRNQITAVLQERLDSLPGPVFAAKALEFCARKMAAASGDMRRALEASTAALELKVQEAVAEQADLSANALDPVTQQAGAKQPTQHTQQDLNYDAQQAQQRTCSQVASLGGVLRKPRPVGIGHMCRAISTLTGGVGSSSMMVQAVKNLPQQQQLLICAATKLLGGGAQGRMHDCSMGQLHDVYTVLCRKVAFCPLTSGEVSAACSTLSDQGILQTSSQQGDRRCRITLRVSEDDVLAAVVDNRLLSNCLSL
ncbi:MAG: cell division control 6 protein [Trebouxia sp. A1-2]|nr:MAG: cell division control 6 protein [Trebouxia sp. A1-2]